MTARLLLVLTLALALSGCGTTFDMFGKKRKGPPVRTKGLSPKLPGGKMRIYGGVRWDIEVLADANAGWLLVVFLIDVPISASFDTLLLPFTVPYNIAK